MKLNYIIVISIILILSSCKKDKVPQIFPNPCQDERFNDKEIRMNGVWELQSNSNSTNPEKIEFVNDSIVRLLPLPDDSIWKVVKYRVRCNEFEYDKYWITDPGPFQNWWVSNSSYNPDTKVWLLTNYDFWTNKYDSLFYLKK